MINDWPECCGYQMTGHIDPDKDCLVGWRCDECGKYIERSLAEILTVADPAAFKEEPKK